MSKLILPSDIDCTEQSYLKKYANLINLILISQNKKKQFFFCLTAPQNGGKTSLLKHIRTFYESNFDNNNIFVSFHIWDFFNSNNLLVTIMYKTFKKIKKNKDIGFVLFYFYKMLYQINIKRIIYFVCFHIFFTILYYLFLSKHNLIITVNVFIFSFTSMLSIFILSIYFSNILLYIFRFFNYKSNFSRINRLIEFDIKYFLAPLLEKKKKRLILFVDDLDKLNINLVNQFLIFTFLIKDRTKIEITIIYTFDIEILSDIKYKEMVRKDILSFVDNHIDILLHIPQFCNNFKITNTFDYHLNDHLTCLITNKKYTINFILNEQENNLFDELSYLCNSNLSKKKKIKCLYYISKLCLNKIDLNLMYLTFFFEIFPCRMNLLFNLLSIKAKSTINTDLVETIDFLIFTKYPYNELLNINKRDINHWLFKKNILKLKNLDNKKFFDLIPYIFNINYTLKNKLENFL